MPSHLVYRSKLNDNKTELVNVYSSLDGNAGYTGIEPAPNAVTVRHLNHLTYTPDGEFN